MKKLLPNLDLNAYQEHTNQLGYQELINSNLSFSVFNNFVRHKNELPNSAFII